MLSARTRFEVLKRDGFRCRYCGADASIARLEVDHVVAVANGGSDDHENLTTACERCNVGKSDVPLDGAKGPRRKRDVSYGDLKLEMFQVREIAVMSGCSPGTVIDELERPGVLDNMRRTLVRKAIAEWRAKHGGPNSCTPGPCPLEAEPPWRPQSEDACAASCSGAPP